jgi:hypothetical protein
MKKVLFIALTLLVTGTTYAQKPCCKNKSTCNKEAASTAKEGKEVAGEMHACCKKNIAEGKAACCSKTAATKVEATKKVASKTATPLTPQSVVAQRKAALPK